MSAPPTNRTGTRRRGAAAACVLTAVAATLLLAMTGTAQAAALWQSSFTTSGFGQFKSTPWNIVGAPEPAIVDSTAVSGQKAARFSVPAGGTRAEVEPNVANFTEGNDYWFGYTVTLPTTFPTAETSWQVITQWKNDGTGSPPVELKVGSGKFIVDGGYGYPTGPKLWTKDIGAAKTGGAVDLVVHIKFSSDPNVGTIDVWLDGVQTITGYKPPAGTLYPAYTKKKATAQQAAAETAAREKEKKPRGTPTERATTTAERATVTPTSSQFSYWKLGLYRDSAIKSNATYDVESARMATSYADAVRPATTG